MLSYFQHHVHGFSQSRQQKKTGTTYVKIEGDLKGFGKPAGCALNDAMACFQGVNSVQPKA